RTHKMRGRGGCQNPNRKSFLSRSGTADKLSKIHRAANLTDNASNLLPLTSAFVAIKPLYTLTDSLRFTSTITCVSHFALGLFGANNLRQPASNAGRCANPVSAGVV